MSDSSSNTSSNHGYWQSLRELDADEPFLEELSREFPEGAELPVEGLSRRRFLQVMSASVALAGLAGCEWPEEEILPFGRRPESYSPGRLTHFATTLTVGSHLRPLLVSSYDGRPIKIEGNPDHPLSGGATDARTQAAILGLYDPDRSKTPRRRHAGIRLRASWSDVEAGVLSALRASEDHRGMAVLLRDPPSLAVSYALAGLSGAEVFVERPDPSRGLPCTHRVDRARVIACFGGDFLVDHDEALRNAREFARGRDPKQDMKRLYCVESIPSSTGSCADHRIIVDEDRIAGALAYVAYALGKSGHLENAAVLESIDEPDTRGLTASARGQLDALVEDLLHAGREALVCVGEEQPRPVKDLATRLHLALGAAGHTALYPADEAQTWPGIDELAEKIRQGHVRSLVLIEANPVHRAAHLADFAELLESLDLSLHLGSYEDETAVHCDWHLPLAHPLESWDLHRDIEGRLCSSQPLIEPLLQGRAASSLIHAMHSADAKSDHQIARESFALATERQTPDDAGFEREWRTLLQDGFTERMRPTAIPSATALASLGSVARAGDFCLRLHFDKKLDDGRDANNAWLQELPDALTKLTWDNALLIAPATAERLGLRHAEIARITAGDRSLEVPALVLPGTAPRTMGLALGYGRLRAGRVGDGVGVNASALLERSDEHLLADVKVEATGRRTELACTQDHWAIDARGAKERQRRIPALVREGTKEEFDHHPEFAEHLGVHHPPLRSLWKERQGEGHQWGMAIDLNRCTSCNACVVACQAENNIPVVGKEQVLRGREMHWLRIDRYFAGSADHPTVVSQPMGCAQCELAPCEQVCPVGATMHSTEGLNVMAYNRCVGTRYCSNNCPYKVRRFNFFNYRSEVPEIRALGFNPEVTIRARGVMEKCTYCVQRIEHARIDAKNERRELRDGEIVTACQQSCPTSAIRFGDLSDAESDVSRHHEDERAYSVLAELNLKPRTRYLARIRNPRPGAEAAVEHAATEEHGGHES